MSLSPRGDTTGTPPLPPRAERRTWAGGTGGHARAKVSLSAIARRRLLVTVTKFVLPVVALGLLALMAIWPELDRATRQAQIAFRRVSGVVEGASMTNARYRGTDQTGHPFTLTTQSARQAGMNRVNLQQPKGDMVTENGGWLMVQAPEGVYLQNTSQLDLSHGVMLYRDDGMTLRTDAVTMDLRTGAAAAPTAVQVEGPMGTLDAQGFVLMDKGAVIQFTGPARMVMNGAGQ